MPDPKQQLVSFPLTGGMDGVSDAEAVQPPTLVRSVNTRLSKTPGRLSKAPATAVVSSVGAACLGVIPHAAANAALSCHDLHGENQRIVSGVAASLPSVSAVGEPQSAYVPARVVGYGTVPGDARTHQNSAVCYDSVTGYAYFATLRVADSTSQQSIHVSVMSAANGTLEGLRGATVVVPPTQATAVWAATDPWDQRWFALTSTGGVNLLWYRDPGTGAIWVHTLSVSGATLTVSSETVLFTPNYTDASSIAIAYDDDDASSVYLLTYAVGSYASVEVTRVNPSTKTITIGATHAIAGGVAAESMALGYVYDGSSGYLAAMVSVPGAPACWMAALSRSTCAIVWSVANQLGYGECTVSWQRYTPPGGSARTYAVLANSVQTGSASGIVSTSGTTVQIRDSAAGTLIATKVLPWHCLVGQAATRKVSSSTYYPVIPVQVRYETTGTSYIPTSAGFVPDPSIELYQIHYDTTSGLRFSCIGRFGVDECRRYPCLPIAVAPFSIPSGNSCIPVGDTVLLTYLGSDDEAIGRSRLGATPRFVSIDFAAGQPGFALAGDAPTVIAGALPACWDGHGVTEFSPLRQPKIYVRNGGGAAVYPGAGTYQFAACISWQDAQGQRHWGPPSALASLVAPTDPEVFVAVPPSYRDGLGQQIYTVHIFASEAGGTTLYLLEEGEDYASSTSYWHAFTSLPLPVIDAFHPAIYSDGAPDSPLASMCPGAMRDAAWVGSRLWWIDAERRARVGYTTPKTPGTMPSANTEQLIEFPASAGELVAVEEWRGQPIFLSTTGLWTIAGEGPDALLNGVDFAEPSLIADTACTQLASVARTTAGVMFASGNRFALYGDGVQIFPQFPLTQTVCGTAVYRDTQEVVFVLSDGTAAVYNWQVKAWSTWGTDALGASSTITSAAQTAPTNLRPAGHLILSGASGALRSQDPATVSTTAQIVLETGWIQLGGPQDDNRISNVIVRGARAGAHGVSIAVGANYEANQTAKTWSAADITTGAVNSRNDLSLEPQSMPARALKLTLTETGATGEAWQPINCTVEMVKNAGRLSQAIQRTGRK